jgi:regulator of RNase E activity RraA
MLPQSPGVDPATCVPELVRAVEELGAVAVNLAADPSGRALDRPAVRANLGSVNVPVTCANAQVRPGDVMDADADGVVVVPVDRVGGTAEAARGREENEARTRMRPARREQRPHGRHSPLMPQR